VGVPGLAIAFEGNARLLVLREFKQYIQVFTTFSHHTFL